MHYGFIHYGLDHMMIPILMELNPSQFMDGLHVPTYQTNKQWMWRTHIFACHVRRTTLSHNWSIKLCGGLWREKKPCVECFNHSHHLRKGQSDRLLHTLSQDTSIRILPLEGALLRNYNIIYTYLHGVPLRQIWAHHQLMTSPYYTGIHYAIM